MTSSEKKNKRKGIIGTILFHALLLVAFLFMGLTYQDPPPAEEGISINFGFSDEGLGEIEPESTEDITEIVEEEIIEEQIESTEEIITQNTVETPSVEKKEEKEEEVEVLRPRLITNRPSPRPGPPKFETGRPGIRARSRRSTPGPSAPGDGDEAHSARSMRA